MSTHALKLEAQAAAMLRKKLIDAQLIEHDDDEIWAATLEGETELFELIDKVVDAMEHDEADALYLKQRMDQMQSRQIRLEHRAEKVRKLIKSVLETVGMPRVRRPYATFSVCPGRKTLEVYDYNALPADYRIYETKWKPNNGAIADDLKAGKEVPGVHLGQSESYLRITKS